MDYAQALKIAFDDLELPEDAQEWLLSLWHVTQALDDVVDGDHVERGDMMAAIWALLVKMPSNPFYDANRAMLTPVLAVSVMKWMASDSAERAGEADERSYMWRAGFYDVICLVVGMVHGPMSDKVWKSLALYGESLEGYLEEFKDA